MIPTYDEDEIRAAIAVLFVNGQGRQAKRLQLLDDEDRDLGGWLLKYAQDAVVQVLENNR